LASVAICWLTSLDGSVLARAVEEAAHVAGRLGQS